jgi:hypothetical protein
VDEVAVAFDNPRLGDEARAQALEKATQPMRNVLDILVNNGVHSNAKVFVSDKVGELQLLELSVHKHLNVSSVSESELQEIRRAIGELKDTLRSAELPNPLRARLVRLLLSIEHALDEYELLGSEAALSALGSLIALSVGARAEIQQGATNGIWEQLSRLVNLMTVAKWGYQAGPVALSAAERFLLK